MLTNKTTGEIFIYDVIGGGWFGDGITGQSVQEALDSLGGKRATVRVNSVGGDANEGIAIYNALRRYNPGVDTVVDSLAASAASLVALAGDTRTTAAGGKWMIHRAMTIAVGNGSDMIKTAAILEVYDRSIVEIYSQYMDAKPDAIMQAMTDETWYTGAEAIAAGLSTAESKTPAVESKVAAWFRHAPRMDAAFAVNRQAATIRAKLYK